jgi:hypothetical protein
MEVDMSMNTSLFRTSQQRRARAVYDSVASRRPIVGILCAEMVALAVFALAAAAFIGLRAWFALPN